MKISKINLAGLAVAGLLVMIGGGCSNKPNTAEQTKNTQPAPVNYALYDATNFGFQISYPQSWTKEELKDEKTKNLLIAFKNSALKKGDFEPNLSVLVMPSEGSALNDTADSAMTMLTEQSPDLETVDSGETTLAGVDARQVFYTTNSNGVKHWVVIANSGEFSYIVHFVASTEDYDGLSPEADQMIGTFKFIK